MIKPLVTYRMTHASLLLAGTTLLFGMWGSALAKDVTITPTVEVEEQVTDNAFSSGSENRKMDLITTVTAGLDLEAETKRTQAGLSYKLNRDLYYDNSELNGTRHELMADGQFELIEDWLRIEGDASISEENIGSVGDLTATNRSTNSSDKSRIINYSIGPTLDHNFGRFANIELSYKYSVVEFDQTDANSDSENVASLPGATVLQDVDLEFSSGPSFNDLEWILTGSYSDSDQEEGGSTASSSDTRTQQWNGETHIRYDISNGVQASTKLGWDENNASSVEDRQNGFYYLVGGRLNMADRLEAELLVGERFGETTVDANVEYAPGERTNFTLSWGKRIQTQQQEIAAGATRDANGQLISANGLVLQFVDQTTLTETFSIDFSHKRSERTQFGAQMTVQSRDFSSDNTDEMTATVTGDFTYLLSRRLTSNLEASYTDTVKTRTDNTGQATFNFGGSLSYDHNDSLSSNLQYKYLVRRQDASVDIRENVLSVKLSKTF